MRPSPLQNRVTPLGDIVAVAERGTFMGNRGIIHDPGTKALTRRWASKAWIICICERPGVRRDVMAGRSWTELFFLDEATALAAGHRPCFFCRRKQATAFRDAWALALGGARPRAKEMDAILHAERLERRAKRLHPVSQPVHGLPDGSMIMNEGQPCLIYSGQARPWSHAGYGAPLARTRNARLITPPAIVAVLAAGYLPALHSTVEN